MSITVNGQSCVPPGFRFHPTEEELLNYYLRKKVVCEKIDLDVIRDVDLNKLEPWDIQEKCRIGTTPQNDWYFFSHKDKKYPTGTRTNRATAAGFWKATGRDKVIYTSCKRIGMRKTLVFYKGRAPHGQKSDWIMHEYRLDDHSDPSSDSLSNVVSTMSIEPNNQEDGWVVCRVFKKKNLHKSLDSPNNSSSISTGAQPHLLLHSSSDSALDQILQYMGRSCKQETESIINSINMSSSNSTSSNSQIRYLRPIETFLGAGLSKRFMKLPALESQTIPTSMADEYSPAMEHSCSNKSGYQSEGIHAVVNNMDQTYNHADSGLGDWAALDRLVASHLNGQSDASKQLSCFDDPTSFMYCQSSRSLPASQDYNNNNISSNNNDNSGDGDLWSLASSGSDHVSQVSHASI